MSVEKCKSAALRYVAVQLRTEGQVADYLRRKEFEPEEIEEAVEMLRDYKYVDDRQYCVSYYKDACRKGRGRRRIEQELERKKISRAVIRETLEELLSEENPHYRDIIEDVLPEKERALVTARKMVRNHIQEGKEADRNFMAKIGRRLMSLGYGSEVIYSVIGIVMKESRQTEE